MTEAPDYAARMPKVVPPVYFLISLACMFALHLGVPLAAAVDPPWRYLGLTLVALGLFMAGSSARRFRRVGTGVRPGSEATRLVREGWYQVTRNPMYLGLSLTLWGFAVLLGSLSPFLVPPIFMLLIRVLFIAKEERWMEERFGEEYRAYKRRTRRWI